MALRKERTNPAKAKKRAIRGVAAAKTVLAGGSVAEAAKVLGVSQKTVYQDLQAPEVAGSLRAIYRDHEAELGRLFAKALHAIDDAFGATKTYNVPQTGALVQTDLPDHFARLKAVAELRHLIQAGRDHAGQADGGTPPLPTYEEVQAWIVHRVHPALPTSPRR